MQTVIIGREVLMHWSRVRHMLCESERFESPYATRKKGLPIIAEDDNVRRDLVERKETLQKLSTLAGIDPNFP